MLLIPIVNLIISIVVLAAICDKFGQGFGFVLGMIFLPFIFLPILGFGSAQYKGGVQSRRAAYDY